MLVYEGEVTIRYRVAVSVDNDDLEDGGKAARKVLSSISHHITEEVDAVSTPDGRASVEDGRTTDCRLMKIRR